MFRPRFQMTILLSLTGLVGFLTSFLLLNVGLSQMWLRYPLAILAAYGAFLVLLRIWLAVQDSPGNYDPGVSIDFPSSNSSGDGFTDADLVSSGGGDFGGAGAGGTWGKNVSTGSDSGGGGSAFDGVSIDLDFEELGLLILAVAAIIGGLLASLYIVYIAPYLLAEILVDGLLVRGLYRRVGGIEQKHWLQTAISRTWVTALLSIIFFAVAGGLLHIAAPGATSFGEVWKYVFTGN